jgi:hypothetical protein
MRLDLGSDETDYLKLSPTLPTLRFTFFSNFCTIILPSSLGHPARKSSYCLEQRSECLFAAR